MFDTISTSGTRRGAPGVRLPQRQRTYDLECPKRSISNFSSLAIRFLYDV